MCPPKIETPEPIVQDVPDPSETADEIRTKPVQKEERRKTGASKQGTLQSLRVDLNVPSPSSSAATKGVGANVPKG